MGYNDNDNENSKMLKPLIAVEQLHSITKEVLHIYSDHLVAAASMEISPISIQLVLKGNRQSCAGFGWRYYNGPTISGIYIIIYNILYIIIMYNAVKEFSGKQMPIEELIKRKDDILGQSIVVEGNNSNNNGRSDNNNGRSDNDNVSNDIGSGKKRNKRPIDDDEEQPSPKDGTPLCKADTKLVSSSSSSILSFMESPTKKANTRNNGSKSSFQSTKSQHDIVDLSKEE